jgi:hypothetical protein
MHFTLQEVLIVGNSSEQVKFSELTIDMFRMLQTLEREPSAADAMMPVYDASPAPGRSPLVSFLELSVVFVGTETWLVIFRFCSRRKTVLR